MYFEEFQKYTIVHIKESEDIHKITSDSFVYVDTSLPIKSKYTISNRKNIVLIGNYNSLVLERNTTLKFENCTNIKLENLCFESLGTPNANGEISLQFCNCQNVEIIGCTFIDCEDEQLAIKHKSNNFYLEHCKFILTKNEYHSFAVLIGYQKNDFPKDGKFNIVFYQCYFNGGQGRYPRCRNCILFMLNCIWYSECSKYLIGAENSYVFIDTCFIECSTKNIFGDFDNYNYFLKDTYVNPENDCFLTKQRKICVPDFIYNTVNKNELLKILKIKRRQD